MEIPKESNGKERICTMSKVFIDTNILIYSMDKNDPEKMNRSRSLLKKLKDALKGVISTQVLQEFYVAATKKLKVEPMVVKNILNTFENFEIVTISPEIIKDGIDCSILNKISFWDALIVVAAGYAKCDRLWTEDLNHGQLIRGVNIINPYHPDGMDH